MSPLEILDKLHRLKTPASRKKFLRTIPKDNEFWFGATQAMSIDDLCHPMILPNYTEPVTFGAGAPGGVFEKFLIGYKQGTIDVTKASYIIRKFASRCTQEEWEQWYKPILHGDRFIPISVEELKYLVEAPLYLRVARKVQWEDLGFRSIEITNPSFKPATVEPFVDATRVSIYLGQRVVAFTPDGLRVDHPHLKTLEGVRERTQFDLVVDAYLESEEIIILRDVIAGADIFEGRTGSPFLQRFDILEGLAETMNDLGAMGVDVIERYTSKEGIRQNTQLLLEQGYAGVVFVDVMDRFLNPVKAHPTKKSVFTCLDITEGTDEYQGKVEFILARGTINKQRVETKVFYGLNWEQRDTYFKSKDQLIGRRFDVLSCGLAEDGRVIMPVFKQWRK